MSNIGSMKTMRGKSMFGDQPLSTRPSAANFGFDTSIRAPDGFYPCPLAFTTPNLWNCAALWADARGTARGRERTR